MTSSLQLAIVNVAVTTVAWLCGWRLRGEMEPRGAAATAAFLMYAVWPLIGIVLAVVSVAMGIRDARRRKVGQGIVAVALAIAVLWVIPTTFDAFAP